MEYELLIREAEVEDAAELVSFLNRVSVETDFTSLDRDGILMTDTEMELFWINRLIQKIKSLY
ncbi:Acetyltransferase [Streptococcus mitis]|uniref:Acetyltransferase n=1 Tax=Streptococcus mitis TaxID=28037 RepID=A0A150NXF5_STRMT|nr:Acetyltransferase [Streptococcus mitis]